MIDKLAPLSGVRILVTRPLTQAQRFIDTLQQLGGQPFHLPTIEIVYQTQKTQFNHADLIIFTSVNAVVGSQIKITDYKKEGRSLPMIAAIGTTTAVALKKAGFHSILSPEQNGNSETLLKLLAPHIEDAMKVIIVRGDTGRDVLRQGLRKLRAQVCYQQVYERRLPCLSNPEEMWRKARVDVVSVSSDLGLTNLITLLPAPLHQSLFSTPLVVNSERCMNTARDVGFCAAIAVATPPGDRGQIEKLLWLTDQV